MNEKEKRIIAENMKAIEIRAKYLYNKYAFPWEEYDEFLQVACLYVCEKMHKFDGKSKFSTFVDAILENAFIDRLRVTNNKRFFPMSLDECYVEDEDGDSAVLAEFLKIDNSTENTVLSAITEDVVKKYIAKAKAKCTSKTTVKGFDALELKIEGYSGSEIAKIFNVPSNSLRMWISRAKKALLSDGEFAEFAKTF